MVAAPVVTGIIVWGYSKMREEGGASSNFAHAIRRAKSRFNTPASGTKGSKWPSKNANKGDSQTIAELDIEPTES